MGGPVLTGGPVNSQLISITSGVSGGIAGGVPAIFGDTTCDREGSGTVQIDRYCLAVTSAFVAVTGARDVTNGKSDVKCVAVANT